MESITAAPSEDSFVPLSEHESQTPSTFFGSRAILHLHLSSVQLLVDSEQLEASPELAKLHEPAGAEQASHAERLALPDIQLWVTSK